MEIQENTNRIYSPHEWRDIDFWHSAFQTCHFDLGLVSRFCKHRFPNFNFQMDEKLKVLEEELGKARNAVKWQRARCHHLVSGLTVKLEQREAEVKTLRNLRDTQLSQILCALLNLEARLRREQRSIRAQLGSRDAIIREQQLEIARLKKLIEPQQNRSESPPESLQSGSNDFEHHVKPDLISSLGIWNNSSKGTKRFLLPDNQDSLLSPLNSINSNSLTPSISTDISESSTNTVIQAKHIKFMPIDNASGSDDINKNHPSERRDENEVTIVSNPLMDKPNNFDRIDGSNDIDKRGLRYVDVMTGYEVQQIRSPSADMSIPESADSFTIIHDLSKIPEAITPPEEFLERDVKHLPPSALLHEMQAQSKSSKNEYHDNPVLECVNQILLRDQEEFLEEQRVLRLKEIDRTKSEMQQNQRKSREDLSTIYGNHNQIKDKQSPIKKLMQNNYHDKPCLMTSTQLKLVGNVNFEEGLNGNEIFNKEPILQPPNIVKSPQHSKTALPPALPPKPLRLLNLKTSSDFKLQQENTNNNSSKKIKQQILPQSSPHNITINAQKYELNLRADIEIIGTSSPALPEPSSDSELYVISNSALDDDTLQQIQGRNLKNSIELQKVLSPVEPKRSSNEITTHVAVHFPLGKKKESQEKISNGNSMSPNKSEKRKSNSNKSPSKNSSVPQVIKVASPVSSLLATVESITNEQTDKDLSKSVLQIVQRFEHLGSVQNQQPALSIDEDGNNALRKNFEEFRLDECDMDALCTTTDEDGRIEADGAENRLNMCNNNNKNMNITTPTTAVLPSEAGVSYESFLEATGLSQKSIMTPSRIFSNHKHVLKPKDVKHRSRIKAAATVSNSTVRYWTEPYL